MPIIAITRGEKVGSDSWLVSSKGGGGENGKQYPGQQGEQYNGQQLYVILDTKGIDGFGEAMKPIVIPNIINAYSCITVNDFQGL